MTLTGKDGGAALRSGVEERTGEGVYRGIGSVLADIGLVLVGLAVTRFCDAEVGRPLGLPTYPVAYCVGIRERVWFCRGVTSCVCGSDAGEYAGSS